MNSRAKKLIPVVFLAALIFCLSFAMTVYADELKVGSVKGLPEKLVVLDDNGQSVSENGEYFFVVEDMNEAEVYSKKIQIMNLREDATYRISMKMQPVSKRGEIDLEKECDCSFYLDDKVIYKGNVSGDGEPDISSDSLDLGTYKPGASRVLKAEIVWNGTDAGGLIDEGKRLVDHHGTTVLRERSGKSAISGETEFKWIFYAEVVRGNEDSNNKTSLVSQEESVPGNPTDFDYIKTGETIAFTAIGIVMMGMLFLIILVMGKKKKNKDEKNKDKN